MKCWCCFTPASWWYTCHTWMCFSMVSRWPVCTSEAPCYFLESPKWKKLVGWTTVAHDHPFTVHGILNGQVPRSPHLKSLKFSIETLEFAQTFADGVDKKNLKAHFHSCNIFFFLLEALSALTLNYRDAINRSAVGSVYQLCHYVLTSVRIQHLRWHEFCW